MSIVITVDDSTLKKRLGKSEIKVDATNVLEAIKQADLNYPGFGSDILTGNELRDSLEILVNGQNIDYLKGLNTLTPADSKIYILRQMVGG